jgi:hypothetical protein
MSHKLIECLDEFLCSFRYLNYKYSYVYYRRIEIINLVTPWSRVLAEKLVIARQVKKLQVFCGTQQHGDWTELVNWKMHYKPLSLGPRTVFS